MFKRTCSVRFCSTSGPSGFVVIPSDPVIRDAWANLCGVNFNNDSDRVCHKHFTSEDFSVSLNGKKRLKKDVLPSLFLPMTLDQFNDHLDGHLGTSFDLNVHGLPVQPPNPPVPLNNSDLLLEDYEEEEPPPPSSSSLSEHDYNPWPVFYLQVCQENQRLTKELVDKNRSINRLNRRIRTLEVKIDLFKKGNLPNATIKNIVSKALGNGSFKYSEQQIKAMIKKTQKRQLCHAWGPEDQVKAMKLRNFSRKALDYVRKNLVPLPAYSTLTRTFSFIHCVPGFLIPMLEYLSRTLPSKHLLDRIGGINFDETKVDYKACLDRKMDLIIGPHRQAQVVQIRGLTGQYKYIIYTDFDVKVTKKLVFDIIAQSEAVGAHIKCVTSDQGGSNQGLGGVMGVNVNKTYFEHPTVPGRKIWWIWDFVHIVKNYRNHLLDDICTLVSGLKIQAKKDFVDLIEYVSKNEISSGYRLKYELLEVTGQDRQRTQPALDLVCHETGSLLTTYFKHDNAKVELGKNLSLVGTCFKIMCSRRIYDSKDKFKCALRVHYPEQIQVLEQTRDLFAMLDFQKPSAAKKTTVYFNQGARISITSVIHLHQELRDNYGVPFFMTANTNQCALENYFSQIKGMDRASGQDHPTSFEFLERTARHIINTINNENILDIMELKPALEASIRAMNQFDIDYDLVGPDEAEDVTFANSSGEDGITYIAGRIAMAFRSDYPELGAYAKNKDDKHVNPEYMSAINRGGLTLPTSSWLDDVKRMYSISNLVHGNGLLKEKPRSTVLKFLQEAFPQYKHELLRFATSLFVSVRIGTANKDFKQKNQRKRKSASTIRGVKKQAQYSSA